jgi:hypothetical protein
MADIGKYSYKITRKIRVRIPDLPGAFGQIATELGKHGAVLGDITKVHLTSQYITRDVIIFFDDEKQFSDTISDLEHLKGYKIISIEDEVLHLHRGGKIAITPSAIPYASRQTAPPCWASATSASLRGCPLWRVNRSS